jgi:hypothetical protein
MRFLRFLLVTECEGRGSSSDPRPSLFDEIELPLDQLNSAIVMAGGQ